MKQTIISKCFSKMKRIMLTLFAALCVGSVWGASRGVFWSAPPTVSLSPTGLITITDANNYTWNQSNSGLNKTQYNTAVNNLKCTDTMDYTLHTVDGQEITKTVTVKAQYAVNSVGWHGINIDLGGPYTYQIEDWSEYQISSVDIRFTAALNKTVSSTINYENLANRNTFAYDYTFEMKGVLSTSSTWDADGSKFVITGDALDNSVRVKYAIGGDELTASSELATVVDVEVSGTAYRLEIPYTDETKLVYSVYAIDGDTESAFVNAEGKSIFELKRWDNARVTYTWASESAGNWTDPENWTPNTTPAYGYPGTKGEKYFFTSVRFESGAEVDLENGTYTLKDGGASLYFASGANVLLKNGNLGLMPEGLGANEYALGGNGAVVEYRDVKLIYSAENNGYFNLAFTAGSTNIFAGSVNHPWNYRPLFANTKLVFKDGEISTEYSNSGFENLSSQEVEINNAKWTIKVNNCSEGAQSGIAGLVKFRDGADRQAQLVTSQKLKLNGVYDFVLPATPYVTPYVEAGKANSVEGTFNVRVDASNIAGECKVPLIKFSAVDNTTDTAMKAVADNAAKLQVVVDGEAIEKAARNAKLVWENGILYYSQTVQGAATVGDVVYASFAEAFAAAQAGDTVKLYQDVKLSEILVINKAITLDGNGCTLTSTAARAINVSGVDGVTIKNLTISASGERAINVIQGATNVTIENVTATAYNYTVNIASSAANAVVAINNSTLNGLCTVNVAAAGAKVTIDGSTVNCNDNNTNVGESYAALCLGKEAVGASIVATNTVVNVTEGSDSVKARNGAENGTITIDDSTDNVTEAVAVISYAGQNFYHSFYTLEEAIGFAKDADTITILKDIATDVAFTVAKKVTIDLNGKTIATTENDKVGDGVFCVIAGGELTINDSVGTGTVNGVGGNAYNIAIWANGGKVVINGGTYTNVGAKDDGPDGAHFDLIYVKNGGKVVINGGTFKAETPAWTLNSHDTAKGTIVVNGGFFYQFNPANCATEGANTNFCADGLCGYVVETVDGVDVYGVAAAVATVGEAKFASLDAAIAAAGAEDEVVVVADIATDAAFEITKKVTINLNGKTIATTQADTEGNGVFWVKAGGELTLNGEGTVNGVGGNAYNIAIWADGGKVIINGGTYTNEGAQDDGPDGAHFDLIYVKNGGAVEINGGTFKCQTPEWTLNSHDTKKGTIVVNGGLFYQFNPSDCATEGAGTNWCAEGLKGAESAENAGYYEIVDAWTAPMPEKDGDADITEEYTSDVLAALEAAVATSVDVKVNGVELKGNEAVKALNTAVKCFDGALAFDGTAASVDIVIEVTEVNTEDPAASTVVVKRGETVLAVKTGVKPTVKYIDLGSDAVVFKLVFE